MSTSLLRLDLTQIFCDVDDFYITFEAACNQLPQLPYEGAAKPYRSQLSLSEVMTIVVAFHGSGFRKGGFWGGYLGDYLWGFKAHIASADNDRYPRPSRFPGMI